MKKIGIFLLALLFAFSCKRDEENPLYETQELFGMYKILSLTSDTALDLNLDGIATTDFKYELADYFNSPANGPFLRILELISSDSQLQFRIIIPKPSFFPQYNDYDITYLGGLDEVYITYYKSQNKIVFTRPTTEEHQLEFKDPIIKNIEVLPDMKLKVTVYQRFYHHPDGWYDCILTGIYEKK